MASEKLLEEHQAAVKRIQEQVKYFHDNKKHFRVYHGSTSSTRPLQFQRDSIVDTSDMDRLFPVDLETMTVKAEPKVNLRRAAYSSDLFFMFCLSPHPRNDVKAVSYPCPLLTVPRSPWTHSRPTP